MPPKKIYDKLSMAILIPFRFIPQIFPYGRVLSEVYEVPKGKLYGWNCVRFKNGHSRELNDRFYSPSAPKPKKK